MQLKYDSIYYDGKSDVPIAVLADITQNHYYFPLSYGIAESIISYKNNIEDSSSNFIQLLGSILSNSNIKIKGLSMNESNNGKINGFLNVTNHDGQSERYRVSFEEGILLSVIYSISVDVAEEISNLIKLSYGQYYPEINDNLDGSFLIN